MKPSNQIIVCLTTCVLFQIIYCEHYASPDEFSELLQETINFTDDLDVLIKFEEAKLSELRQIRKSLQPSRLAFQSRAPIHPIHIFVTLNRLRKAMDIVLKHSREDWFKVNDLDSDIDPYADDIGDSGLEYNLYRVEEDLRGSGTALLMLQATYGLNVTQLVDGNLAPNENLSSFKMKADDCFELGRIAYEQKQYGPASMWMYASLELAIKAEQEENKDDPEHEDDQLITDILDHLSYASYKLGLLEYSIKFTQTWLARDPQNERARKNLEYYIDELSAGTSESPSSQAIKTNSRNITMQTFHRLCLRSGIVTETTNKCLLGPATYDNGYFYPGVRSETLSEDPKIIRVYDIVTPKEAEYLQRESRPKLQRATVYDVDGKLLHVSDHRIAKVAKLGENDTVVKGIENRLASILDIGMDKSEMFQVVSYGIGGFFTPHMDTLRAENSSRNETKLAEQLKQSDRYATILIYLNDVDLGGATIFPLLNLTAPPIARSAIVWFNILENGYADERTLHSGCPVASGSKWIALKWAGETANSFAKKNQRWWLN